MLTNYKRSLLITSLHILFQNDQVMMQSEGLCRNCDRNCYLLYSVDEKY